MSWQCTPKSFAIIQRVADEEYEYGPFKTREEAEHYMRDMVGGGSIFIIGNQMPAETGIDVKLPHPSRQQEYQNSGRSH